tara:strand:- start:197 stop:397 length:201 start_codon:yes stop_codon:yes gene_type:complete
MTNREIIMRLEILTEMMTDLTGKLKQKDLSPMAIKTSYPDYESFSKKVRNLKDVADELRRLDDDYS